MSALQAVSRPTRSLLSLTRQSRIASTSAHDPHHQHEEHDSDPNVYAKETFFTPFWRRTILATFGLITYAKFAPADFKTGQTTPDGEHEAPWLTRILAHYAPKVDNWSRTNEEHLVKTEEKAQGTLTVQSAKLPPMPMRNRILKFEQVSPHRVPVGGLPDLDDLVVKP